MSNLLSKLENNEAILMMYLAGELPLQDRLEVDQMLQRDNALRAQCTELRRLFERTSDDFAIEAARIPMPAADEARERLRPVIRQWATNRLVRPMPQPVPARRSPWFLYPLVGTAAALVLVAFILSQIEPLPDVGTPRVAYNPVPLPDWQESTDESLGFQGPLAAQQSESLISSLTEADPLNNTADGLVRARSELYQIQQVADAMATGWDVTFLR